MYQAFRPENSVSLFKGCLVQAWWPTGVITEVAEAGDQPHHIASSRQSRATGMYDVSEN